MAVDAAVSRALMEQELADVRELALLHGWSIAIDPDLPKFTATLAAHNGDRFFLQVECDDYRELPPYFEFLDPETRERGTKRAYPYKSGESFFHEAPCICAPFNRKAYKAVFANGPHADWSLANGDWAKSTANGYTWSNISRLGDMLHVIQTRLLRPEHYERRMG
jgi:hypothetical protein